jgi:AcrR family transcriptional regulator
MSRARGIPFDTAKTKQAERIKRIVEVSADLFSTKGYLETSMEDIAEAAGLTKGGAYYYFGSKSDILYFICTTYINLDLENLAQTLAGKKNGAERLRSIVFRHIAHYANNTSAARTLLNEAYALPPENHSEVLAMERKYFNMVRQVVSEYLGNRHPREIVTALTFTLFGMMNWIYSWYDPKGKIDHEKLAHMVFQTFTKGATESVNENETLPANI